MDRAPGKKAFLVAGVLVAGLFTATPAAAGPPGSPKAPRDSGAAGTHQVTLITGDVVRVETRRDGSARAEVVSRTGRSSWYDTSRTATGLYVQPEEAAGALADGRLDRELFNVTGLVTQGYDDRRRAALPVILTYGKSAAAAKAAVPTGAKSERVLPSVNGRSAAVDKGTAGRFWTGLAGAGQRARRTAAPRTPFAGGVAKVWLDQKVHASLDQSVPLIGGPAAWGRGFDGTGVKVAVLDTGVDTTHPDLAGRVGTAKNFTGSGAEGDVTDRQGHGTHVASIAAGDGSASQGKYKGVAPKAEVVAGKVLGDDGSGLSSWAISGMEWAAQQGVGVVNLSLGSAPTLGDDPASQAINSLTAQHGTLFVVAAGNRHTHEEPRFVTSPGAANAALTVGMTERDDRRSVYGRRGAMGDKTVKPEIYAPGWDIRAAQSSTMPDEGDPDPRYRNEGGTSMAAPHVAGAAALLRQQHPGWRADRLKAVLTSTAKPAPRPIDQSLTEERAGRVDVDRATRQQVSVDTGVFHGGYFAQPHDPTKMTFTRTLTYSNGSDGAVALDLAGQVVTPEGQDPPSGVVSVTPSNLTVPAGGSAQATVTVNVAEADAGQGTVRVAATGGSGLEVQTVVGFYKQGDTTDVNVKALDRRGQPAYANVWIKPYELDGPSSPYYDPVYLTPSHGDGLTLRLPPGKFHVYARIVTLDESGRYNEETSFVGDPLVESRQPNFALTLDARKAKPISLSTPRESEPRSIGVQWARGAVNQQYTRIDFSYDSYDGAPEKLSVAPTETVSDAPFVFMTGIDAGLPVLKTEMTAPITKRLGAVYEGGPRIDGVRTHNAIDAGSARPEDLEGKDLRGKVALVKELAGTPYEQQAGAVADAGAAAVLLYSAQPGVFWPILNDNPSIPTLALTKAEGEDLVQRLNGGPVTLRFTGSPRTPYAYDVAFTHKNSIPDTMAYSVTASQLAEVRSRIHGSGMANEYTELTRAGISTACEGCGVSMGDFSPSRGYVRTEYVTARPDTDMRSAATIGGGVGGWRFVFWPITPFRPAPGQVATQNWMRGPIAPGPSNSDIHSQGYSNRFSGNYIAYDIAGGRDSDGHWTGFQVNNAQSRLFKGTEEIGTGGYRGGAQVPPERATYRLELDTEHNGSQFISLSTKTSSTWTFTSAASAQDTRLPLVDVIYSDLTGQSGSTSVLDLNNSAPAGQAVALRLKAGHQKGSSTSAVQVTKVEVSYDGGTTWRTTTVRAGTPAGNYQALYTHPALASTDGHVAVRVSAKDGEGNQLDQTIIRAYRLKG